MTNPKYHTEVKDARGFAIGDHNIIYNYIYCDDRYANLAHGRVYDFSTLIEHVTGNFVGRQFVFDALDQFLRSDSSGYFVIQGEPGIGKTTILAELVKIRKYPHHFNVAAINIRQTAKFLANICTQIIARYKLDYYELPWGATMDSSFLLKLLKEAAEIAANRPIVVLVDALDEVEHPAQAMRENLLCLPSSLPNGVYFVVTCRPLEDEALSLWVECQQTLDLRAGSKNNMLDARTYIRKYCERQEMVTRLGSWEIGIESFADVLLERSEGNFMYLHHALPEIEAGRFREGNIHDLPRGLKDYYCRHWQQMRGEDLDRFVRLYQPVIAVLATAGQAVSARMVSAVTGLKLAEVQWVIGEWRQFLVEESVNNERRYRLYHNSFRDFLAQEKVG